MRIARNRCQKDGRETGAVERKGNRNDWGEGRAGTGPVSNLPGQRQRTDMAAVAEMFGNGLWMIRVVV